MTSRPELGHGIREVARADRRPLTACLSRAFEDDPVSNFIFPDDRTRLARLAAFYREIIRITAPYGVIHTDDGVRGAAIWRTPSPPPVGRVRAVLDGLGMLRVLRGAVSRALQLEHAISAVRPRGPHWYLAILGTDPSQQGHGVASALIAPVLACCDADRLPAYLESSKEDNIPFYERHGFRVTQVLRIPEGPTLWSMLRDPRPPAA
jgi:GNAT superfamily N-acetyltransferase